MSKRSDPWFKFYPSDWRSEPSLRAVSMAARALWIEMLCLMHEAEPRGHLLLNGRPMTDAQLAALAGVPVTTAQELLGELETAGTFSRTRAGVIYSRRMRADTATSAKQRANVEKRWKSTPPQFAEKTYENDGRITKGDTKSIPKKPEARSQKDPPTPQGAKRRKPEVPIPDDCPSSDIVEAMQAEARAVGANVDLAFEARQFRDWWTAKDGRNRDWDACWRTWARRAIAKAPKTAIAALTARTAPPSPSDRWDGVVREFRANGYWNRDDNGPPPGREGCRAPPSILALYGYATAAKHANDPQPQEAAA